MLPSGSGSDVETITLAGRKSREDSLHWNSVPTAPGTRRSGVSGKQASLAAVHGTACLRLRGGRRAFQHVVARNPECRFDSTGGSFVATRAQTNLARPNSDRRVRDCGAGSRGICLLVLV